MADTYTVERRITVDAPAAAVYQRLVDFHRWSAWSPFEELDPGMKRTFSGPGSGKGSVYEWAGSMKAGTGRMEIEDATADRKVVIAQQNLKPFKTTSTTTFALDEAAGSTTVTWSMTGSMTTAARLMGIFKSMDKVIGPVFEKGLAQLKVDAENGAA